MKRLLFLNFLLLPCFAAFSNTIVVKNIEELNKANKEARPGEVIILQNGDWKNVTIALNCAGTKDQPIIFKAEAAGKVIISGNSMLKLGGSYIVVDGLYFTNGYSGDDAAIDYRINKDQLASNCRVTNCVVNDFNNPKRLDENYWVSFSGRNNRLDHCSFVNKKNLGVLLAVILDDDRSRENFHSIDHNYFGVRIPLASNGGEIIRVGVSQHCQFNSNTQIVDNFFEHCDGEAEVISIKSGRNVVRGNLLRECQGSVVLRHGDNNTVENNLFLGNDKEGTGGVRVINKGQWIVNNLFYKCRGTDFRSPLAVMNGIPNSPANRYVQVTDAVIANNTFYNCSPFSLCEGSDTERSLPPQRAFLVNNIIYNTKDPVIFRAYDNTGGISFIGNEINKEVSQPLGPGFVKTSFVVQKNDNMPFLETGLTDRIPVPDSLQRVAKERLTNGLSNDGGFHNLALAKRIQANAYGACGAKWFDKNKANVALKTITVTCKNAGEVYKQLERKEPVIITLGGNHYKLDKPFIISKPVVFTGNVQRVINIDAAAMMAAFVISDNGQLGFRNLNISGSAMMASNFIANEKNGSSNHYNLSISDCELAGFDRQNGCQNFFMANASMVADSIIIRKNHFSNNKTNGFMLNNETDNKGYYNVEKISFVNNSVSALNGTFLSLYRGGSDESTMGPKLRMTDNRFEYCNTIDSSDALIQLTGVQQTYLVNNSFINCNPSKTENSGSASRMIRTGRLINYTDIVRANHIFHNNSIVGSGAVHINKYVSDKSNYFEKSSYRNYY